MSTPAPVPPHYSPSVAAGGFVFLAGQLGLDDAGKLVGNDIESQTAKAIDRIEALLKPHGMTLADVVKSTVWVKRLADFAAFNRVYAGRFGANKPARSSVVSDLVIADALVEIEVIAHKR